MTDKKPSLEERMIALAGDPEIYDPEALDALLTRITEKYASVMREAAMRDGVIVACRRLCTAHGRECGIADLIGQILESVPTRASTKVVLAPVHEETEAFEPMVAIVESAQTPDGFHSRARSVAGVVPAEAGPLATLGESRAALEQATLARFGPEAVKAGEAPLADATADVHDGKPETMH